MSLGLRGPERNHPDVQEALKKTIMTAQKYGKNVMFSVGTNLDQIKKYKEMGITMFEISSDIAVLRSVWNETKQIISEMA
jgi:2-keto-3-deoxy-L-rhamnonate aldolase RhmA